MMQNWRVALSGNYKMRSHLFGTILIEDGGKKMIIGRNCPIIQNVL